MSIQFGVCQWSLPGNGLYAVRMAAELGLDGVQLGLGYHRTGFYMEQKRIQQAFLEDAAKYGVKFPSICLVSLEEHSFIHNEGSEEYQIAFETLTAGVETARAMNIGLVMVPSFFRNDIQTKQDVEMTARALRYVCEIAGEYGINVAHESTVDAKTELELLDMVGMPNISVFYDSQNYRFFKNLSQQETLKAVYPRMCRQLHVKDGSNDKGLEGQMLLGQGDSGFFDTMDILKDNSYSGWIFVENYYWKMPLRIENADQYAILQKDLQTLKTCLSAEAR